MKGQWSLQGKVALVTGAARGTGEATARLFAAEGARVVIGDVLDAQGADVAKSLGDTARYVHLDVRSEADWVRTIRTAEDVFGGLDVLVNNAAVLHLGAVEDTSVADFERVMGVNQLGTFLGIRSAIEPMRRAGRGSIVNISSVDGFSAKNGVIAYAATKWAVRGMTRVAALELGRFGIRVNAVCPEAGSGDMIRPYVPEGLDIELAVKGGQPNLATQKDRSIGERIGDVANMVLFLASDASASCTGADFIVDGGNTAGKVLRGVPGS
jgi:3alpha(or 20beta)-hydroxysteroid dehydrogenase